MKLKETSTGRIVDGQIIDDVIYGLSFAYYDENDRFWKLSRLNGTAHAIFVPVEDAADVSRDH